jgi:5-methylcytosine-specific restriction endonuclease McrA
MKPRGPVEKPRRKAKRRSQRDYADRLFRQRIRERDEMTCQAGNEAFGVYCGGQLEVAHYVPRRVLNVRWTDTNAALLCSNHHGWLDGHPLDRDEWFRARLGSEYDVLRQLARERWNKSYDEVLGRLKAQSKEMA